MKRVTFTEEQMQALRKAYGEIQSFPIDKVSEASARVGRMSDEAVLQMAESDIRWLSVLARNETQRRRIGRFQQFKEVI